MRGALCSLLQNRGNLRQLSFRRRTAARECKISEVILFTEEKHLTELGEEFQKEET